MGKTAFVFSGQGDQFPGMGKELYYRYEDARRMFHLFDRVRPGTSGQCFFGTAEELKVTANTQPCLFAMEIAAAEVLKAHRILPDAVAGFSLGEVAACTFAGMFRPEQGFSLTIVRGRLMEEAAADRPSFMGAVLRLDRRKVEEICREVRDAWAVNFNCPGQITVAGTLTVQEALSNKIGAAGGRLIPLPVGGGFHSPLMTSASERFRRNLDHVLPDPPCLPVYSNVTGRPYDTDADVKDLLAEQIKSPVLWEETVRNMIRDGIDTFIEVGPGKTLTGLIRRIDRNVRTYPVSDLAAILEEVKTC